MGYHGMRAVQRHVRKRAHIVPTARFFMLPKPVARQMEVVCLPTKGHQVVLGTAGSGKTTMAILRAKYLTDSALPGGGPTLIITFNKALVSYIGMISDGFPRGVAVENYHKFARGYLASVGKMDNSSILSPGAQAGIVAKAVSEIASGYEANSFFQRSPDFFLEEIRWLERHGISSPEDYVQVTRTGRADARLDRAMRPVMWKIFVAYLAAIRSEGKLYDLDNIASSVALELESDARPRRYKHIVVDEGQDLSPEMIRSLAKAIPPGGSLTFFGDVAQQIYGHRMSWRSAGLAPLKVWEFKENYRNTRQIAQLGLAISKMPYYAMAADMISPVAPSADGPKPTLVKFDDEETEITFAVKQAASISETRTVAILARTGELLDRFRKKLPNAGISLKYGMNKWKGEAGMFYGTYHSAKGIEFDVVILPFMSSSHFPDPKTVETLGAIEAAAGDGRLLYVGVTRARVGLIITHTAEISTLLPVDDALYARPKV